MKKQFVLVIILLLLVFLTGTGCGSPSTDEQAKKDLIKIGVFPITEILPLVVGEREGFFEKEGVQVEIITFQSSVEKEGAFQAGSLDAIITDVIVAQLMKNSGVPVRITSLITGVTPEEGPFGLVAAPKSNIKSLQELQGKKVGICFNSIIEYVFDGLAAQEGLTADFAEKVPVTKIPVRMEMLMEGQLDAAVFPEPFLSLAEFQGAPVIRKDTSGTNLSQVVFLFQEVFVEAKKDILKRFYKGYAEAIAAINANPDKYHQLLVAETRIPEQIKDNYGVPMFPSPELPAEKEIEAVSAWLEGKNLLQKAIKYEDLISDGLY